MLHKALVNGSNAAKGSRQTGCVPLEDAVAQEAKALGPVTDGDVQLCQSNTCDVNLSRKANT